MQEAIPIYAAIYQSMLEAIPTYAGGNANQTDQLIYNTKQQKWQSLTGANAMQNKLQYPSSIQEWESGNQCDG